MNISFQWDKNTETDIAGYRVFCREEGRSYDYTKPSWEGPNTTCTIYNLDETKTYYFVSRSFNSQGLESSDSNELYLVKESEKSLSSMCLLDSRFQKTTIDSNITYYTDRNYILTRVPSKYVGMDMIKTPNDDRNLTTGSDYLTFEMPYDGTVYIAYDSRATSLPSWMSGFSDTGDRIYTSLSTQPYLKIYKKSYSQFECANFGANKSPGFSGDVVSNYVVLYSPENSPSSMCILDSRFQQTTIDRKITYYTDRDYTLTRVPSKYVGMDMIKTPNDDRNLTTGSDYLTFEMPYDGTVYIAYDSRATSLPNWMSGFSNTGDRIYTSLISQPYLKVYSKTYNSGTCVNLGANKAPSFSGDVVSNFIVFW